MNGTKRKRVRAIIIIDNKIISMYRELEDRIFYTFPGGAMEGDESEEDCVIREVYEEFGINIKPIKKVYIYENERSIEYFYLCDWIDGEFGTGNGEEFQPATNNGVYLPSIIEISSIPTLPLMPAEVASSFYEDYTNNGNNLRNNVKLVNK